MIVENLDTGVSSLETVEENDNDFMEDETKKGNKKKGRTTRPEKKKTQFRTSPTN